MMKSRLESEQGKLIWLTFQELREQFGAAVAAEHFSAMQCLGKSRRHPSLPENPVMEQVLVTVYQSYDFSAKTDFPIDEFHPMQFIVGTEGALAVEIVCV